MLPHLQWTDFAMILASGAGFFVIRKILTKILFSRVSRLVKKRIQNHNRQKDKFDDEDKMLHKKETLHAIENLWFSAFYPIFTLSGFFICKSLNFFSGSDILYRGMPQTDDFFEFPQIKYYYLSELGFYVQALFSLIFIDQRMKDFNEYLIHHLSTLFSLTASYSGGFHRIGIMVLLLHDVTDIFLYSSKFAVEIGYRGVAAPLFAAFIFCYTFLRLMYFPYLIFKMAFCKLALEYPGHQYFFRILDKSSTNFEKFSKYFIDFNNTGVCMRLGSSLVMCVSTYRIVIFCAICLIGLHVYWYRLAIKVLIRSFGKDPKVYDIRKEGVNE